MTKSYIGKRAKGPLNAEEAEPRHAQALQVPTAEVNEQPSHERQRSRSQPPSLRKSQQEDLRYPNVPLCTLKAHFFKGKPLARKATGRAAPVLKAIRRTLTPRQKLLLV